MDSLCHPGFTTTNLSYRFPIFETSATAFCGTTGIYVLFVYMYNMFLYVYIYINMCNIYIFVYSIYIYMLVESSRHYSTCIMLQRAAPATYRYKDRCKDRHMHAYIHPKHACTRACRHEDSPLSFIMLPLFLLLALQCATSIHTNKHKCRLQKYA